MAILQWSQGTTHLQAALIVPFDLTGLATTAITLALRPNFPGSNYAPLAGSCTAITNASGGAFTYQFASADVATPGWYKLAVTVAYSGGNSVSFEQDVVIQRAQ